MKFNFLLMLLAFFATNIKAQWSTDPQTGNIVTNIPGEKINQQSVSDGQGGMIVAFVNDSIDYNNNGLTTRTLCLQKLDAGGSLVWGSVALPLEIDRVLISYGGGIGSGTELPFVLLADGSGGVFIAWAYRFPSQPPHVQHINAWGSPLWGAGGVSVSTYNVDYDKPLISLCPSGKSVIVGWNGKKPGAGSQLNMFAQRLNEDGAAGWLANGIQLADTSGIRAGMLVSDGSGGAIAYFMDDRNTAKGNENDIYAQRVDSNGARLWGNAGKPVCARFGDQQLEFFGHFQPEVKTAVAYAGGQSIVCFRDSRNGIKLGGTYESNWDTYAQKLDAAGNRLWDTSGVAVSKKTDNQFPVNISVDNIGGVIVLFMSSVAPYIQRLAENSGQRQLGDSGICVAPFLNRLDNNYSSIDVNDSGEIFVSTFFADWQPPYKTYLTVQKYDSTGKAKWDSTGFAAINTGSYLITNIVANPNGSVINSWSNRVGETIHALMLYSSGSPSPTYHSVVNGNWNDASTWVDGVEPNADSKVIINSIVTITANATCYSLQVGPGGQIIVPPGVHFSVLH